MKKLALMGALGLSIAASPVLAADAIEGLWRTTADDNGNSGLIEVTTCGNKFCGTLVKAFGPGGDEIESDNVGRQLIWDTVNKGGGVYRGKVYSPDRDKTYNSKLIESNGKLSVSGCVLGICREGGVWMKQ